MAKHIPTQSEDWDAVLQFTQENPGKKLKAFLVQYHFQQCMVDKNMKLLEPMARNSLPE